MESVTTISFFKYSSLRSKVWAFAMMAVAPPVLARVKGLQFFKLMGSGQENFNPLPDWSVYAILQVWESEVAAETFFETHPLVLSYQKRTSQLMTIYLRPMSTKGLWSGTNPFEQSTSIDHENPYLVIITRATIKLRFLIRFWKFVPYAQAGLKGNPGLLYTKGIGEVPIRNMATFSLWKNKDALQLFAYEHQAHKKAITLTKKLNWYKEELFARFQPYRVVGEWDGISELQFLKSN